MSVCILDNCDNPSWIKRGPLRGMCASHFAKLNGRKTAAVRSAKLKGRVPIAALEASLKPEALARRNASIRLSHSRLEVKKRIGDASREAAANRSPEKKALKSKRVSEAAQRYWDSLTTEERKTRNLPWIITGHAAVSVISSIEVAVAKELDLRGIFYVTQQFIGPYPTDFFLRGRWLIIECDGVYWHSRPGIPERDAERDRYHRSRGFKVV